MVERDPLAPLLAALRAVADWLEQAHAPGAIIGGVAASLLGLSVPLATPEDILVMKAVARRPRDFADIEFIIAAQDSSTWRACACGCAGSRWRWGCRTCWRTSSRRWRGPDRPGRRDGMSPWCAWRCLDA